MRLTRGSLALLAAPLLVAGCETVMSDVATRIRYGLGDAAAELGASGDTLRVVTLKPNHSPDGCGAARYRVRITPYRGDKQVPSANIAVSCDGGHNFGTGTPLLVAREMSVMKGPDEPLRVTLRKTAAGIEVDGLD